MAARNTGEVGAAGINGMKTCEEAGHLERGGLAVRWVVVGRAVQEGDHQKGFGQQPARRVDIERAGHRQAGAVQRVEDTRLVRDRVGIGREVRLAGLTQDDGVPRTAGSFEVDGGYRRGLAVVHPRRADGPGVRRETADNSPQDSRVGRIQPGISHVALFSEVERDPDYLDTHIVRNLNRLF